MKKLNLSKQLLLAGSIMAIAFACQSKKSDGSSMQQPMDQTAPCNSDDGSCSEDQDDMSSNQSDENASAPQAPAAPVVEKAAAPAAAPTATAPAPVAPKAEASTASSPKAEAPKLEAVKTVTENRTESTSVTSQK